MSVNVILKALRHTRKFLHEGVCEWTNDACSIKYLCNTRTSAKISALVDII